MIFFSGTSAANFAFSSRFQFFHRHCRRILNSRDADLHYYSGASFDEIGETMQDFLFVLNPLKGFLCVNGFTRQKYPEK
jgi:hypothetical protein